MINWLNIKDEYISGVSNYRELSEKYGVSPNTIRKKAAVEKWREERTKYAQSVHKLSQEKTADTMSAEHLTKIKIRVRLLQLGEEWLNGVEEITDTYEFRRMVQSFADMGVFDKDVLPVDDEGVTDDPLTRSLKEEAERLNNIYVIGIG